MFRKTFLTVLVIMFMVSGMALAAGSKRRAHHGILD